ncbi:hypothetical protein Q7C36_009826 [Tachysurus vachellii]|uniref:Uncharacterized protein n=1 Tax=Tachysurus vachellii TaxID=175792 RepID=A0AA88SSD8_TACVA|nr:hypothetical protein Q7C36_009826 [Tachysurus vachellii]
MHNVNSKDISATAPEGDPGTALTLRTLGGLKASGRQNQTDYNKGVRAIANRNRIPPCGFELCSCHGVNMLIVKSQFQHQPFAELKMRRKCGLAEVKTNPCGEGLYSRFCEGNCSSTVDTGNFLSKGGGTSRKRSAAQEGRVQDLSWTLWPERSLPAP